LQVAEIDILDGTPLLDIKPYVPDYDAYPGVCVPAGLTTRVAKDPLRADSRSKLSNLHGARAQGQQVGVVVPHREPNEASA
jgi:hypothetical protein